MEPTWFQSDCFLGPSDLLMGRRSTNSEPRGGQMLFLLLSASTLVKMVMKPHQNGQKLIQFLNVCVLNREI